LSSAERRIWAPAAPSCRSQAGCLPGAARRRASGRRGGVPLGCIRVGVAADPWLYGEVWEVMGEPAQLDLCPSAHPKSAQRSGSCARRVLRGPPDGSAKCFGCLLVGCRPSGTPGDSFLVSQHAFARLGARGRIELIEAARHCMLTCCCFALTLAIRLLTNARGGAGTCSRSFGLSRAANYDAIYRHLASLTWVPSGAKSPSAGHCMLTCCCFALTLAIRLLTNARGGAGTCSRSFGLSRAANYDASYRHLASLTRFSAVWAAALQSDRVSRLTAGVLAWMV
jgi:hypothetical protein